MLVATPTSPTTLPREISGIQSGRLFSFWQYYFFYMHFNTCGAKVSARQLSIHMFESLLTHIFHKEVLKRGRSSAAERHLSKVKTEVQLLPSALCVPP